LHFKPVVDRQGSAYDRQRKRRSLSCNFDRLYCCRNTWGLRVKDWLTKEVIVDLRCFSLIAHRQCSRWVVGGDRRAQGTLVFRTCQEDAAFRPCHSEDLLTLASRKNRVSHILCASRQCFVAGRACRLTLISSPPRTFRPQEPSSAPRIPTPIFVDSAVNST
jgi:hypothetical protein